VPIFEYLPNALKSISETTFGAEGIMERSDIQSRLREQISVLDDQLLVVAEEFCDWGGSTRRIDLLCIDSEANLVVVELKRTEDGGHMELQALRYAAMVSAMTFDQLVGTFARFRNNAAPDLEESKQAILDFLGWDEANEDQFAQDTRIVLAAADFSKELTTAVMWLIERGVDIRCVRIKPYRMDDGKLLLNVEQLIPLPEATDFQTQIGVKKQAERQSRTVQHDLRSKFWEGLLAHARTKTDIHAKRKPTLGTWIHGGIGRTGFALGYVARKLDSQVELWISLGGGQAQKNKAAFEALAVQKCNIEKEFGSSLEWQELPKGDGSRIRYVIDGGYKSPPDQWSSIHDRLVDAMVRLDGAMRSRVAKLPV
jgi:Domain of unknown function (DUF4268)